MQQWVDGSILLPAAAHPFCVCCPYKCVRGSVCGSPWLSVCVCVCLRVWLSICLSSLSDAIPMQCLYLAVGAGAVLAWKSHLTAACFFFFFGSVCVCVSSVILVSLSRLLFIMLFYSSTYWTSSQEKSLWIYTERSPNCFSFTLWTKHFYCVSFMAALTANKSKSLQLC